MEMKSNETGIRTPIGNRVIIYTRGKKKTWTAEFWHDGDHRRKSLKTQNKKVAIERAANLEHQLQEGEYQAINGNALIEDAIESDLSYLQTENRARKTIVRYRGELRTFRDFCHGQRVRHLQRITPTLFVAYRAFRKVVVKPRTLYHESMVIKQLLKWSTTRKLLRSNPLREIQLSKPVTESKPAPNLEKVQKTYGAASERDRFLIAILASTGMRSGELRQMRTEDVDLEEGWFKIVSREETPTKTRTSRKVPIHSTLIPMMKKHMEQSVDGWLFTAEPSGKYPAGDHWIDTKKLNERFVRRVRKLGLPAGRETNGYTIHSLRHFFETFCVKAGVPQRVVDAWLGHSSDKSMAAVYYSLSDEESQRFMHGLNLSFSTPTKGEDDV